MHWRLEKLDRHEAQNLSYKDSAQFSEKFCSMYAWIHDSVYYYVDSTDIDMQSVTEAENCPHREYKNQRLHCLQLQLSFAKNQWKPNDTSLLESLEKACDDIKYVGSSEFHSTLSSILYQYKGSYDKLLC